MFDFHFVCADGNTYDVEGVTKILFSTTTGPREVEGKSILDEKVPLTTMCLYSESGNVTVSGKNLMVVDILKRDE